MLSLTQNSLGIGAFGKRRERGCIYLMLIEDKYMKQVRMQSFSMYSGGQNWEDTRHMKSECIFFCYVHISIFSIYWIYYSLRYVVSQGLQEQFDKRIHLVEAFSVDAWIEVSSIALETDWHIHLSGRSTPNGCQIWCLNYCERCDECTNECISQSTHYCVRVTLIDWEDWSVWPMTINTRAAWVQCALLL